MLGAAGVRLCSGHQASAPAGGRCPGGAPSGQGRYLWPGAPLRPPRGRLTCSSEALPALVSCLSFSEAAALLSFPVGSALLFSRSLLHLSFSLIFRRFWNFFFLLSRFLSVAVFSAAVFMSPALFFSFEK